MTPEKEAFGENFDPHFKIFHELMPHKIRNILLVSTPYDAWILEEDCRLSERIINEYRGLNLSHPPRLTRVATAEEALKALARQSFELVITMPRLRDMDGTALGRRIKHIQPDQPVVLLSHSSVTSLECWVPQVQTEGIDRIFIWSGNTDILVALIKSTEDRMNVVHDTARAGIRVILLVEDSPFYVSSLLPLLYKELVHQSQAVMEEGLNEEHRLLTMRARPKILVAGNYEEATALFGQFEPYVLGVISDVCFPRAGKLDDGAGIALLSKIKKERFDIPLLLTSSEASNASRAVKIPALFVDKNSASLQADVRAFVNQYLGFGEFVFSMPDGTEIARASNLRALEKCLHSIPAESFISHCSRNDFSRWLFARTETVLAAMVRPISHDDFEDVQSHRQYLIKAIHARRKSRQKGIVADFDAIAFDLDTEFFKIGQGSLGGKARGLAFISSLLKHGCGMQKKFAEVDIMVPQTLVITTEAFESFIDANALRLLAKSDQPDQQVAQSFLRAEFPDWITRNLRAYLSQVTYPLAVRSSSLLEDAQFRAYAGLYHTYMLVNDHADLEIRLHQLIRALKLVYASTYLQSPKTFARRVGHHTEEEKMAVIIQQLVGERHGDFFYPAISGVAQSRNYYPFSRMKPEDGIATIALGLGKTVMDGEKSLRFSPRHPQLLPQCSTVDDLLECAQRTFYALNMGRPRLDPETCDSFALSKRELSEAASEPPVRLLTSTYIPEEHRIRDTYHPSGFPVLTFAHVLKFNRFPLPGLLAEALSMGEEGMGCPVELEFSVNLFQSKGAGSKPEFAFLQLRPMTARVELATINIVQAEIDSAFCFSEHALGNVERNDLADIIYVKPDIFDPAHTPEIANEIGGLNNHLVNEGRKYLLIGPGRWGSADRWLGIPVGWAHICGVGAMVEAFHPKLRADPSQGSHFFHNITTMGINYITITEKTCDFLNWTWLTVLPVIRQGIYAVHARMEKPFILKVDGRSSRSVMYE